jgi:hypothetical protein
MRHKLLSHLTFANVVSMLALFFALGVGAYAANTVGSSDVIDDSLLSVDVKGKAGNSTTAAENGTLTGVDVSGQAANPSVGQPFVDGSLTGADVKNNSLTGADISESTLGTVPNANSAGRAASVNSFCDPASASFTACGTVTLTLPTSSRVMVVASGQWYSASSSVPSKGECRVTVDGAPGTGTVLGAAFPGETVDTSDSTHEKAVALNGVTDALPAGPHTFGLYCTQDEGDITMDETFISAASFSAA